MVSISFTHPEYLFFLFAIPVIIFLHFIALRTSFNKSVRFANFDALAKIRNVDFFSKNIVILTLSIIIVALLTFSLAGANLHTGPIEGRERWFVIAIDSSASMETTDVIPTRLEAAKNAAISFVDEAPAGTNIGVISFSGISSIEIESGEDKILTKKALRKISSSQVSGTDIYEAVVTSANVFSGNAETREIIILSDGQINLGTVEEAISYAARNDIIVHTIAVGTVQGGESPYGTSTLNEEPLRAISYNTGGSFTSAGSLATLSSSLHDLFEFSESKVKISLSNHLSILALMLFILEFFLINTKYRRFP